MKDGLNASFTLVDKAPSITRSTGLMATSQETIILDPRTVDGKAVLNATAGQQFKFPTSGKVGIVRSIQVMTDNQLASVPGYIGTGVITQADLRSWMVTLVAPDSTVLHKDVPLLVLRRADPGKGCMPRYFDERNMFDLRQCYLTCTVDGQNRLLPFRYQYNPALQ